VIVRLPALADLIPTGENLFAIRGELPSPGSLPSDPLAGRVRQGCLEESNVDVERELRELDGLRRQARALEAAAQGLSFGSHELINPAGDQTTPSHVAGSLGADRH
jgi:flagellar basal body rod protein FlgG